MAELPNPIELKQITPSAAEFSANALFGAKIAGSLSQYTKKATAEVTAVQAKFPNMPELVGTAVGMAVALNAESDYYTPQRLYAIAHKLINAQRAGISEIVRYIGEDAVGNLTKWKTVVTELNKLVKDELSAHYSKLLQNNASELTEWVTTTVEKLLNTAIFNIVKKRAADALTAFKKYAVKTIKEKPVTADLSNGQTLEDTITSNATAAEINETSKVGSWGSIGTDGAITINVFNPNIVAPYGNMVKLQELAAKLVNPLATMGLKVKNYVLETTDLVGKYDKFVNAMMLEMQKHNSYEDFRETMMVYQQSLATAKSAKLDKIVNMFAKTKDYKDIRRGIYDLNKQVATQSGQTVLGMLAANAGMMFCTVLYQSLRVFRKATSIAFGIIGKLVSTVTGAVKKILNTFIISPLIKLLKSPSGMFIVGTVAGFIYGIFKNPVLKNMVFGKIIALYNKLRNGIIKTLLEKIGVDEQHSLTDVIHEKIAKRFGKRGEMVWDVVAKLLEHITDIFAGLKNIIGDVRDDFNKAKEKHNAKYAEYINQLRENAKKPAEERENLPFMKKNLTFIDWLLDFSEDGFFYSLLDKTLGIYGNTIWLSTKGIIDGIIATVEIFADLVGKINFKDLYPLLKYMYDVHTIHKSKFGYTMRGSGPVKAFGVVASIVTAALYRSLEKEERKNNNSMEYVLTPIEAFSSLYGLSTESKAKAQQTIEQLTGQTMFGEKSGIELIPNIDKFSEDDKARLNKFQKIFKAEYNSITQLGTVISLLKDWKDKFKNNGNFVQSKGIPLTNENVAFFINLAKELDKSYIFGNFLGQYKDLKITDAVVNLISNESNLITFDKFQKMMNYIAGKHEIRRLLIDYFIDQAAHFEDGPGKFVIDFLNAKGTNFEPRFANAVGKNLFVKPLYMSQVEWENMLKNTIAVPWEKIRLDEGAITDVPDYTIWGRREEYGKFNYNKIFEHFGVHTVSGPEVSGVPKTGELAPDYTKRDDEELIYSATTYHGGGLLGLGRTQQSDTYIRSIPKINMPVLLDLAKPTAETEDTQTETNIPLSERIKFQVQISGGQIKEEDLESIIEQAVELDMQNNTDIIIDNMATSRQAFEARSSEVLDQIQALESSIHYQEYPIVENIAGHGDIYFWNQN